MNIFRKLYYIVTAHLQELRSSRDNIGLYAVKPLQPQLPESMQKKYWRTHALRDKLANLNQLTFAVRSKLSIKVDLLEALPEGKELIDVALENNDPKAKQFVFLSLLDRMLNDFCHYTYFGLMAIHPAHIAPAYSLFRKPFTQTLPFLEWAIDDFEDFMSNFVKNIEKFDDVTRGATVEERRRRREKISKRIAFPFRELINDFLDVDLFDTSLHLVTTRRHKTENLNMNFIFLNDDKDLAESHTDYIIYLCAIYLAYGQVLFLSLLESIEIDLLVEDEVTKKLASSLDTAYDILHSYALMLAVVIDDSNTTDSVVELFNLYAKALDVKCKNCLEAVYIEDKEDLFMFADYETLICTHCKHLLIYNEDAKID